MSAAESLAGRAALVSGGDGTGRAIRIALAHAGADVTVLSAAGGYLIGV